MCIYTDTINNMKIVQRNKNNTNGYFQKENTDFGVDENGNLAQGFQFHNALVWKDSPGTDFLNILIAPHIPLDQLMNNWYQMFYRIADYLVKTYQPKYVLELGSGNGELCAYIRKINSDIVTVTTDANREVVKSPYIDSNHFICRTDKTLDFVDENGKKILFDLIISFDHFEHIHNDNVNVLMENIKDHSKIGTILIFTASQTPYTDETYRHVHCNPQSREYWLEWIKKYGFEEFGSNFSLNRAGSTSEIFAKRVL